MDMSILPTILKDHILMKINLPHPTQVSKGVMQRERVEAESITHKYYNSSTKPKFYKNTRLIDKIIEKTSLANFYSKTHIA